MRARHKLKHRMRSTHEGGVVVQASSFHCSTPHAIWVLGLSLLPKESSSFLFTHPLKQSPLWFFEYHLNFSPVALGQQVALHLRAADYFNASLALKPVAEGQLEKIMCCSPNWLTFQIVDLEGREVALLRIPYAPSIWLSAGL